MNLATALRVLDALNACDREPDFWLSQVRALPEDADVEAYWRSLADPQALVWLLQRLSPYAPSPFALVPALFYDLVCAAIRATPAPSGLGPDASERLLGYTARLYELDGGGPATPEPRMGREAVFEALAEMLQAYGPGGLTEDFVDGYVLIATVRAFASVLLVRAGGFCDPSLVESVLSRVMQRLDFVVICDAIRAAMPWAQIEAFASRVRLPSEPA